MTAPSRTAAASVRAWSEYWSSGAQTSCLSEDQDNYTGVVRKVWWDFFATLPRQARVLDLATGNGAIARLALEFASENDYPWRVYGVDRAHAGEAANPVPGLHLLSAVAMENLPFAANMFDAVTGQYAVEYGARSLVVKEVARVLKPRGGYQFLMHLDRSHVVRRARRQLREIQALTDDWRLLELLGEMLRLDATNDAGRLLGLRRQFDAAAAQAVDVVRQNQDSGLINETMNVLGYIWQVRAEKGLEKSLERVRHSSFALDCLRQRLTDLCNACLDETSCQQWREELALAGLPASASEALSYQPGHLVAWRITRCA